MRLDLPELGRLRVERVSNLPAPSARLWLALGSLPGLSILDSAADGRYTVIGAMPMGYLRWTGTHGEISLQGGARVRETSFPQLLRGALSATALSPSASGCPYGPGWMGYLGYGLRTVWEDVPERHPNETGMPDASLAYYPAVAVYDAEEKCWRFMYREVGRDVVRNLRSCLMSFAQPRPYRLASALAPRIDRAAYLRAVERAVQYIYAGDIFQVNFAHEFRAKFLGDALALYTALRDANPAPYGAYVDLGRYGSILSTSPELFLRQRGQRVVTRPIKGTRPRGNDAATDEAERVALLASEKDAAELAMIVDLERNDLGRVCRPGTIKVDEAAVIESYTSVHHRVAQVSGELEDETDRLDVLAATFPGGSITGAPKIRAMEIIDELEAGRRGPYTGSIGILTDQGDMELNIAIRTALVARGHVHVHVGGGIVADSDPALEYEETLDKGRAMFAALQPESPSA